ncbi:hypothetical protein RBB77_03865 [Tunturibacter psychrotolerans]|uniref:Nuclear transport factor 2 family protein n=1 Tax=Tunturiibacter psychrotolerans TaxID=3069686 RepID=A0AAU7ZSZ6_9BACT
MENFGKGMRDFLERFERNANSGDVDDVVAQFADVFLKADPGGTHPVSSSALRMAIPQRKKMFESSGYGATTLASVKETKLDDRYVLLQTEWLMRFEGKSGTGEDLTLRTTFLVHCSDEGAKIVLYLSHEEPTPVLRGRGSGVGEC